MADNRVWWIFKVAVKPGSLDSVKKLVLNEMVPANEAEEPGTLAYEWYVSADGDSVHVREVFTDSAAALFHVGRFGEKFAARLLELATVAGWDIYGEPSDEFKAAAAAFNPTYRTEFGGFTR